MIEQIRPRGDVYFEIKWDDGTITNHYYKNTILQTGRAALASSLANDLGSSYDFFISRMIFGDGGTVGGVPQSVSSTRNGLFGLTRAVKPIIATIDPNLSSRVIFTTILTGSDANGYSLNEMALQMNNGDLYSMVTFADLNKTSAMQITFNWSISFIG